MGDRPEEYLAFLPGPRGENAEQLRRLLSGVVDDYLYWRRNYYPDDPVVLTPSQRLGLADTAARLDQHLEVLEARLRRSFPFHSPRYVAHQQSEVALGALAGGLLGMLYNANNVTTESGNVSVEVEIEAASKLIGMIGYTPPPAKPGPGAGRDAYMAFRDAALGDYAWCHLTSGGTAANIEALWVARNVTYQAVWVAEVCREEHIEILVTPSGSEQAVSLADLDDNKVLNLPPSESTRLLSELYDRAVRRDEPSEPSESGSGSARAAVQHILECFKQVARARPLPSLLAEHPPALFVTGARHYSLDKAVDVLGLGGRAVVNVASDSRHRMDLDDLVAKVRSVLGEGGRVPLALIAIVGTTEEGAVDPLHRILALRRELEAELEVSPWVHADAAWGGYLATLGHLSATDRIRLKAAKALTAATGRRVEPPAARSALWVAELLSATLGSGQLSAGIARAANDLVVAVEAGSENCETSFASLVDAINQELADSQPQLRLEATFDPDVDSGDLELLIDQQQRFLQACVTQRLALANGNAVWEPEPFPAPGADREVLEAVHALRRADSVTVDPHKMGYQQYACGAIAFRDDRCRAYVHQRAPYLTDFADNVSRQPLAHAEPDDHGGFTVRIEAPGAFTLEGSRPSGQATGLWLATEVLGLDQDNHGRLVRDSWRSARQLYSWLREWDRIEREVFCPEGSEPSFRFVIWTADDRGEPAPPDTNLVIFGVVPTVEPTFARYVHLTEAVYKKFSIAAERGEHQHSYSQPFFVSRTEFAADSYPPGALSATARNAGIVDFDEQYKKTAAGGGAERGVIVLRSTVMNPYLFGLQTAGRADLIRDLVVAMAEVARAETRPGRVGAGGSQAMSS